MKVQSETGILRVTLPDQVGVDLPNKAYLWSPSLTSYIEQGMIMNSGRITNGLLNTLLHRDQPFEEIKLRTMTDIVETNGTQYLEAQNKWADNVLKANGWDSQTVMPLPETDISKIVGTATPWNRTEEENKKIDEIVNQINSKRSEDARIPEGAENVLKVEPDQSKVVEVSLDGVSSKRQKDSRPKSESDETPSYTHDDNDGPADYTRAPDPKKRPKVETAVAHIKVGNKKYVLSARNMFMLCKLVLAFLLEKNLLLNRSLIIYSDGGIDIRKCVDSIFSFCPKVVLLDWFHLRKHCYESLSMGLKGGKANRNMQYEVRRHLFHILWAGNVDSAIHYLESLDSDKVKNRGAINGLVEYLRKNKERGVIACYALRSRLNLRISSNPVEKANDLLVSSRQKGKCMSWSRDGSWALAALTCMYLNNEAALFHANWNIMHNLYTEYGRVFDMKSRRLKNNHTNIDTEKLAG